MTDQRRITIRPYVDTRGDGMMQLSFTLPIPHGPLADGSCGHTIGRDAAHESLSNSKVSVYGNHGRDRAVYLPPVHTEGRAKEALSCY